MSSSATPKQRKRVEHKRERKPARPARSEDIEPGPEKGSFIEPVTQDDPATTQQPSLQKEPPRAPGP